MPQVDNKTGTPVRETFNRPPRIWTSLPQGTVTIPAPPARDPLPPKPGIFTLLLPIIMVTVLIGVSIVINHGSTQALAFMLPIAVFSIMTPVATLLTAYQKNKAVKRKWRTNDKNYRAILAEIRVQLTQQADEQRQIALLTDPDPSDLEGQISERSHLWERRPEDPDFLSVRVGKGTQPFSVQLQMPEIDTAEPLRAEVEQFRQDFANVKDIPCSVSLPKVKSLGITGRRQDVADFTRDLLCQVATHHSPEDVRIFALYPVSQRQDWEWLGEFPHTKPLKATKQERLLAAGQEEADQLLNGLLEELSQRASKNAEAEAGSTPQSAMQAATSNALPHVLVVVHDYIEVRKHPALTHAFKLGEQLGVSVIYLVAEQQAIPSECRGVIRIFDEDSGVATESSAANAAGSMASTKPGSQGKKSKRSDKAQEVAPVILPKKLTYAAAGFAGETLHDVNPDIMKLEMAKEIAHTLAPLHVAVDGEDTVDLPTNVRLLDLLGLSHADRLDVNRWWSSPPFGRLRIPIGQSINGTVWIDLSENVHGPHGIIAGTTGAGKSELLQSLIVGLAATHHPHLVNFVLVDFKGGAAFKAFEKIPHTVGVVTDLSGRLTERALAALKSELRRREHILSKANAKKIAQYQAMRTQDPSAFEPLPNLFIIIDEFAELAKEHPLFMEGLVSVVQKGRSLGVHLILATQKPTGSVNPNIWSNLKFRICLRVASLQDSRDMLGRSEAALLPSAIPGRAYFQIGSEIFELFQSARVSLPARVSDESIVESKRATAGAEEVTDQQVLMDSIEPYQATLGAELFRPWPEPLPHRVSLPDIYRRSDMPRDDVGAQLIAPNGASTPPYGWLRFPVGLIDLPTEQRQEPLMLDLPHSGGNVLVAGASGAGKSVFLRTLITSLVQTHTASQLHLYLVDFGGQALRVFEKLPHVGGVFGEPDEEYIRRLLRKLDGIIEERKQICMTHQIDDFLVYQRRRIDDATLPELPAVVLVIDKFIEFRQAHDKEMDLLLSIARSGRNYGVYLVLSLDRPVSVPTQLMSLFELRIGLRLVELTDSLILLGKHDAAHLDPAVPGRGYQRGKNIEEVHIALPVSGEDEDEQTRHLDEWVAAVAREAEGPSAPPIRLLPEYVRIDDFLIEAAFSDPGTQMSRSIRLSLGIEDLSLQPIALELNADTPHVLVGGGPGSGRTGVLQTCLMVLASMPGNKSAQVILVDFRRSSRSLRRLPNIWMYADTEQRLAEAIEALKTELRARATRLHDELEKQEDDDEPIGVNMPPILLIIDDYDQVSALTKNPLNDLKEFLLQARDLRLHIIVTGSSADLLRSDMLLPQVRACRMGVILGGDPADSPLLGVRMNDLPPGRGYLVRRNQRNLVQVGHLESSAIPSWVARLQSPAKTLTKDTQNNLAHACPWCTPEAVQLVDSVMKQKVQS